MGYNQMLKMDFFHLNRFEFYEISIKNVQIMSQLNYLDSQYLDKFFKVLK